MRVLFIHPNFPAQFRHLITVLGADSDNTVVFVTANPRSGWEVKGVRKVIFKVPPLRQNCSAILRPFLQAQANGEAVLAACMMLKSRGFIPDIIYGHSGWGATLYIKDVFPQSRFLAYCEWFYNKDHGDALFGAKRPLSAGKCARLRMRNIPVFNDLVQCDRGVSPTFWQRSQFPRAFQAKISCIHDGIDTDFFRPDPGKPLSLPGIDLVGTKKIITYVSRGMEPYRGFPQFMESLTYILKENKECRVIIVGSERICYGAKPAAGKSYKEIMLAKLDLDLSRVHFTGILPYSRYLQVLQASTVHIYLTRPFVLSWSMLEAMSCGCVIVASNTPPVREVIRDGENGLLADFFSPEQIAQRVLAVLDYPSRIRRIGEQARHTIQARYSLSATLPLQLKLINNIRKIC